MIKLLASIVSKIGFLQNERALIHSRILFSMWTLCMAMVAPNLANQKLATLLNEGKLQTDQHIVLILMRFAFLARKTYY